MGQKAAHDNGAMKRRLTRDQQEVWSLQVV